MAKRNHMNCCKECRTPFELTTNPDYCEDCRVILGIDTTDYDGLRETEQEIEQINWGWLLYKSSLWE